MANLSLLAFKARPTSVPIDHRAIFPRTLRMSTAVEAKRGIMVVYAPANFAVYRAVIERLIASERFRMETQFGPFEMSRSEFESTFSWILDTASYSTGSDSMPGKCYYVQGPPPIGADRFRVAT